jgi:cytochrome P450
MLSSPGNVLRRLAEEEPGIYPLSETSGVAVVSDPEAITHILTDDGGRFSKGPLPMPARLLVGDGTATSWFPPYTPGDNGGLCYLEEWRLAKRTAVIRALAHTPLGESVAGARKLAREACQDWSSGQAIDIYAIAHTLFFRLSMEVLFGCPVTSALLDAEATLRRSAWTLTRHLRSRLGRHVAYFDRLFAPRRESWRWLPGQPFSILRQRRAALDMVATQLLQSAGSSRFAAALQELPLPTPLAAERHDLRIRTALLGLLLASFENSATAAAWLVWTLTTHAPYQHQIFVEMQENEVRQDNHINSTLGHPKRLYPTLWNSLQETLRLYPPVWSVGRVVRRETGIGGVSLQLGETLLISPWLQHRHPALWDQPHSYDPERFAGSQPASPSCFMPFGSGGHGCPGELLARLTICAVVREWLDLWRFQPAPNYPAPEPMLGLTQRPEHSVWVEVSYRSKS